MSSNLFYDSDDERDSFDIERQQIENFQRNLLSASVESSEDDEEGIIDGTKIPSSTKVKSRARHSFLDISTLSSTSSISNNELIEDDDKEENPFDIISKTIDIENSKPIKKKKSLGVAKSRIIFDTNDIYDQDDSNHSRESFSKNDDNEENTEIQSSKTKTKVRKPTKTDVLETERKMQQLSRSEHLVLPTFIPKPLETWRALEKRSRQELMNEIRAKNPSFTPQDPELPEIPPVDIESTAASTLADLTKLIEDKPTTTTTTPKPSNKFDKLSRFLNPDILKKKPTIQTNTMIDLTDTRKVPTIKAPISISLDCIKSPSSSKKLFEMQKQLGIRMRAKRAAMLAENNINIPTKDEEEEEEEEEDEKEEDIDDDSMDTTNDSVDVNSEIISNADKENEILPINEETRQCLSDEDDDDDEEVEDMDEEEQDKENTNPSKDSNRPSLKTILTRLESSSEPPVQVQPVDQNGQTEWFNSARPAQFDSELEMLCSGAFGEENIIPPSQNYTHVQPMAFSPLPPTQIEEDDEANIEAPRPKVRQLIDDDDDDEEEQSGVNSGSNQVDENEEEQEEEEEDIDDNEELVDYKKQLFEMEAEESGSENEEKNKDNNDESDSEDDDDEPDEELQKFIDTAAVEIDEDEEDNLAKVHLKLKAKEDEQQLKLLKEQYLDFDGDDDGRRIKISKVPMDDDDEEDDPDYNSEVEQEEDDDEEDEPIDLKNRISELERQRSLQDTQAEELHLNEDLDNIGQHSSMFQKGLALKQKKIQNTITSHTESSTQITTDSNTKKSRSVTLSSVLLAKRFSSTLLVPVNKNNITVTSLNNTSETTITTKKQHNPRRHVFATTTTTASNENQNPVQLTTSGEKRANSTEKSPKTNIKRFKQTTTTTTTTTKESTTSVFSALALSNTKH